jgi:hypothetical protein
MVLIAKVISLQVADFDGFMRPFSNVIGIYFFVFTNLPTSCATTGWLSV